MIAGLKEVDANNDRFQHKPLNHYSIDNDLSRADRNHSLQPAMGLYPNDRRSMPTRLRWLWPPMHGARSARRGVDRFSGCTALHPLEKAIDTEHCLIN